MNPVTFKFYVNCDTSVYTEDEGVMIAYQKMSHETCPLIGGYQMLLHEGVTVRAHCLDTIQTYNPRLEFSCDGNQVLADFGQDCAPTIPTQGKGQMQVPFAYLQCVGSWVEPGGDVNAVLLQMKDDPHSFWCMHYKSAKGDSDELLTIYLSFDGKCSGEVFNNNRDIPDSHSMFGILAKYVPVSDSRCFQNSYIKKCRSIESTCFETAECPLDCQRCNKKIPKKDCGFDELIDEWTTVDSSHGLTVNVKKRGFKVTEYGVFSCYGKSGPEKGGVYSMVRNDPYSSCLPLYTCAKVFSPAKGILNFYLRLAERDGQTGEPKSCTVSPNAKSLVPGPHESTITLLNTQKLQEVPCNIERDMLFPSSLGDCRFSIKKCADSCTTFYGDYDTASCGNNTVLKIEHDHICHARLLLTDGIHAIISRSKLNQRFLCWIFTSQRLFVTVPEHCNSDGAMRIFSDENAQTRYDPFLGISLPEEAKVAGSNEATTCSVHELLLVLHCALFILLIKL